MTFADVIRSAVPGADASECEHILWGMTPYPCGPVSARDLYKAASRYKRAGANGIRLCDCCSNKAADEYEYYCKPCGDVLRGGHGVQP